jgi:hypothetical protein
VTSPPRLPHAWSLLDLKVWAPCWQGPQSLNADQNASERRSSHLMACLGSLLPRGGLLTVVWWGIPPYAQVRGRWAWILSVMPSELWNHRPPWPRYPHPSLGNLGLFPRRSVPRAAYHHLTSTCACNATGLLCSLSLLVLE